VHEGRVVLARGYGLADLGAGLPATDTTPFAIGSVTKQFATAAALLLAEEGRLSMDDKVAKWYPSLTRAKDITLGDLVHHVSGYPDYYPLDFVDRRMAAPTTAEAVIARYAKGALDFEPGAHWSYSNTGYFILGRIVERVSGMPFGTFLQRRFFGPLGMTHTRYEPAPGTAGTAHGYVSWALGPLGDALPEARGWTGAAGGIFAPAGDLARWDLALMEGRVLKPASWSWVTTPRQLNDGSNSSYGGGQFLGYVKGWQLLDHGGAVSGFLASNTMIPGSRSAVVVLVNSEYFASSMMLRSAALDFFLADSAPAAIAVQPPAGSAPAQPPVPAVAGMTAEEAARMMFKSLQTGTVDRRMLSEEHNFFLSDERLRLAATSLGPLGEPQAVEAGKPRERGGLEVTSTRFTFPGLVVRGLMYRRPDGTIEEFLVTRQ
ncbi:MAG: beta-lactamase family protein, partial [Gemmatimonadota bacterium]|nr:beta-lactamase family protein [Gemmatimonadota bacterium]